MTTDKIDAFSMADIEKRIDEIVEQRITDARREVEQLRDENVTLNLELAELQKRVEALDRNSKRGSVVVKGISQSIKDYPGTSPTTLFVRLCDNVLNEDIEVIDSVRLSSGDYIFKLASVEQAQSILSKRREFKGLCYVNRNLTRSERNKSYNIRVIARKLTAAKTAKVRCGDFSLFVNKKVFSWYDGKFFTHNKEDAQMLNTLFRECNVDMTCDVKPRNNFVKCPRNTRKPQQQPEDACCLN